MKKILILGATSQLGKELSYLFSNDNHIILFGRSKNEINELKKKCETLMPKKIETMTFDLISLDDNADNIFRNRLQNIDIIINLISSTSRVFDNKIASKDINNHIIIDVINVIRLMSNYIIPYTNNLKIIHISSILEEIKTPNRTFYSTMKTAIRLFFESVKRENKNVKVMYINIGTIIDHSKETAKSARIARKIHDSHIKKINELNIGFSGKVLKVANKVSPILVDCIIFIKRLILK